jgi:lysophospholipase L1-like esterase
MKKISFLRALVLVLIGGILVISCDDSSGTDDYDGPEIVIFGDSLSSGHPYGDAAGLPTSDNYGVAWPATFEKWVNIPVFNVSRNGNTTGEAIEQGLSQVKARNAKVIVVELGANDFLNGEDPQTFTYPNLNEILEALADGECKIFVAKFYTEEIARAMLGAKFGVTDSATQTAMIAGFDQIYNSLLTYDNVSLITDIWQGVWGTNMHPTNDIHPSEEGCKIMAGNYFKAMKGYLEEEGLLSDEGKAKL